MKDFLIAGLVAAVAFLGAKSYQGSPATPDSPVGVVGELGKLVADDDSRAMLAGLYGELADAIEADTAGVVSTTEQFRRGYIASATLLVQGTKYEKTPAFDKAASDRITAAIGLKSVAITPETKAKLVSELRAISKELGG